MKFINKARLACLAAVLALAGCGGGGDDSVDGNPQSSPEATALSLAVGTPDGRFDGLSMSWNEMPGATRYEVMALAPGQVEERIAQTNGPALQFTPDDPPYLRVGTRYRVRACDGDVCSQESPLVTPDLAQAQRYLRGDAPTAGDGFGQAVALSDDGATLAVGAPGRNNGSGAVLVMRRSGSNWIQEEELAVPQATGGLGMAVALSADGQVLLAGAPGEENGATAAVYVFRRNGSSWEAGTPLDVPPLQQAANSAFGLSVALSHDGKVLAVGAPSSDTAASGRVLVFRGDSAGWTYEQGLTAQTPLGGDRFGSSVALSADGEVLAVGAPGDGTQVTSTVYVFKQLSLPPAPAGSPEPASSAGNRQVWSASLDEGETGLGTSVSLSADGLTLAMGMPLATTQAAGQAPAIAGAVRVVDLRQPGSAGTKLSAALPVEGGFLGYRVALSGDATLLAASAPGAGTSSAPASGEVRIFQRVAGNWQESLTLVAPNAHSAQGYGSALALSARGRMLAVGAALDAGKAKGSSVLREAALAGDGTSGEPLDIGPAGAVFVY